MKTTQTLIESTGDLYSSFLSYTKDGLNNGNNYLVSLDIETQNPQGGAGMTVSQSKLFNVNYPILRVLNKPILTQLLDKSAVQIDWADICVNPGATNGQYSYVENFLKFDNTAIALAPGSTLNYSTSVIPSGSTHSFMIQLPITFNGIIRYTNDGLYKFGYDLSLQKFYTIINDITTYGELIKITINPFFITLLNSKVIIRQYNVLDKISNIYDLKISDIYDYPIAFMTQTNN